MQNPFEYQFEWDPIKAHQNTRKHGVTFERAATVFLIPKPYLNLMRSIAKRRTDGLPHRDLVGRMPHLSGGSTDKREDSDYVGPYGHKR
jgi:hypothetical protein